MTVALQLHHGSYSTRAPTLPKKTFEIVFSHSPERGSCCRLYCAPFDLRTYCTLNAAATFKVLYHMYYRTSDNVGTSSICTYDAIVPSSTLSRSREMVETANQAGDSLSVVHQLPTLHQCTNFTDSLEQVSMLPLFAPRNISRYDISAMYILLYLFPPTQSYKSLTLFVSLFLFFCTPK